jgi:hypothetical protein
MGEKEWAGVGNPYDPIGPDGKPVRPLSYRNVLRGGSGSRYKKERLKTHFVKRVCPDEYPLNTSYVWSGINEIDIRK